MKKHILIVDDESNFRFSAGLALRRAGYEVSEAVDGKEALLMILNNSVKNDSFDLLLIDIQMPEMSGIELIDELKKNDVSIPIFAVSGFAEKPQVDELLQKGCSEFLDKPFKPQELVKRIGSVLKSA